MDRTDHIFNGEKMVIQIPENLRKYCSLAEGEDIVDRFVCPVCDFSTRLGPGAIRMHMIMKSDPLATVYEAGHEEFYKANHTDLTIDSIKELAAIPYRTVTYNKNV